LKEFFRLLFHCKCKELLITPTDNTVIQFFRAVFVGGAAFVTDAGVMWLLLLAGLHYLAGGTLGFILGVTVNYVLSSLFVFRENSRYNKRREIVVYLIVSLIGLGITLALLWLFVDVLGQHEMVSKCVAAMIAFIWNFSSRKVLLY